MAGEIMSEVTARDSESNGNYMTTANYSTKATLGGLIIYVRAKPWSDTEFAQVLLPVALSYETFVCKLCVAMGVPREMVKKVVKLPDILIRTTEDVIRLTPYEKLELVLHRSLWKHQIQTKWERMRPWCSYWFWTILFMFSLTAAVQCNGLLQKFEESSMLLQTLEKRLKTLETKLNSKTQIIDNQNNLLDGVVKQLTAKIQAIESTLADHFNELDERFQQLSAQQVSLTTTLQEFIEQQQQQQANKLAAKRKIRGDS